MAPEFISAAAGLVGVVIGIVGTITAARIQSNASRSQADAAIHAARAQADAAIRAAQSQADAAIQGAQEQAAAALSAAQQQAAAALAQQANDARRRVYAQFLDNTRAVQHALADRLEEDAREELRAFRAATAMVQLEGPSPVDDIAAAVQRRLLDLVSANTTRQDVSALMERIAAPAAHFTDQRQQTAAEELQGAIAHMTFFADPIERIPRDWRKVFVLAALWGDEAETAAPYRLALTEAESRSTRPNGEVLEMFQSAAVMLVASCREADRAGVLDGPQAMDIGMLVQLAAGGEPVGDAWLRHSLATIKLSRIEESFRLAARAVLHGDPLPPLAQEVIDLQRLWALASEARASRAQRPR
ncbi:hypothetical protein [Streptomyces sp. DSM 41634]|uniref:hypothetical protein n=1 Tax=Streptomyces sp. DSM 41634 TaxID=3448656 RepID=UPI00403FD99F